MPASPGDRTVDELVAESQRLEAASLDLQERAAALDLRVALLRRLTQPFIDRQGAA